MKITAILGAGALAIGSLVVTAAPAAAQRHGHHGYDRGHQNRGHHYGQRGYNHRYSHQYRGHHRYARTRVVCRVHRGYYGPVRRCFRVYR